MLDAWEDEDFYLLCSGISGHKVLHASFPTFEVRLTPEEFFYPVFEPLPRQGPGCTGMATVPRPGSLQGWATAEKHRWCNGSRTLGFNAGPLAIPLLLGFLLDTGKEAYHL